MEISEIKFLQEAPSLKWQAVTLGKDMVRFSPDSQGLTGHQGYKRGIGQDICLFRTYTGSEVKVLL